MIRLKEILELTPEGNLRITDLDDIAPAQWERINRIMVQKGYNMRGPEDCKRAIAKFLTNSNNDAPDVINKDIYDAWVETISMVMHLKGQAAAAKGDYDCRRVLRAAIRHFGHARDLFTAGYILPNGDLLHMSGGSGAGRDRDHREIGTVYVNLGIKLPADTRSSGTPYMTAFMKDCRAIRIGGSQPFTDMWNEPTRQQAQQLIKLFQMFEGEMILTVKSEKYGAAEQQYKRGTSPNKILQDIVTFYRTGEFPEKLFESTMLDELKKTDLSRGGNDHKFILVFRSHLFILDKDSDISQVKKELNIHPEVKTAFDDDDVNDFLIHAAEAAPDVLVGEWYPDHNGLVVWNQQDIIPQTSIQVKKAAKQLGIDHVTYRYMGYVDKGDSPEKDLPVKKIKGEVPKVMYHGTSTKELMSILKYGLDPDRGPSQFARKDIFHPYHVFLAATPEAAQYYAFNAVHADKKTWEKYPIIIEIGVPDPDLLVPDFDADTTVGRDPYYEHPHPVVNKTLMKPMGVSRETGKWGYKGRIPASFIKWVYYYNTYQKKWHKARPETWIRLMQNHDWETISWKLGMQDMGEPEDKYRHYWQ